MAALAAQADVEARLGRSLTEAEAARLPSLVDDASAVLIGYCGQDFEPPAFDAYPVAVVGVVAKMVARAFDRAGAGGSYVDQEGTGPYTVRYSAASSGGDVWLSAADKLALRPYRRGGGLASVATVGVRYNITPGA